jgi:hypothetical protein
MRTLLIILTFITIAFYSCNKEEELNTPFEKGKYHIEDNPDNFIQHYIFDFNQKYGTILLTNPTEEDYKYNFLTINDIKVTPPKQDEELLKKTFELLEETFFDLYSDEFKKKNFPVTIQLADTIKWYRLESYDIMDMFASQNFLMIGNINKDINEFDAKAKEEFKIKVNTAFWVKYLYQSKGLLKLPESYLKYGEKYNGEFSDEDPWEMGDEAFEAWLYSIGFIDYDREFYDQEYYFFYPTISEDLEMYMRLFFTSDKEYVNSVINRDDAIKTKYNILKNIMKKDFGVEF